MVILQGIPYTGKNKPGDFNYDVKRMSKTLFIVNENFIDKMKPDLIKGSGTACLRYLTPRFNDKPLASGMTTGWSKNSGGFKKLDLYVQEVIELDIQRILRLVHQYAFERIIFSSDANDDTKIGCNIFKVDDEVLGYISDQLFEIPKRLQENTLTFSQIEKQEQKLFIHAKLIDENVILRYLRKRSYQH